MRKLLALLLLISSPAFAAPAELASVIKAEKPMGAGQLRAFFLHINDVELWTDAPEWSYDAPFALSITYQMNFTRDELVESTIDEMKKQHPEKPEWKETLERAVTPVRKGDRLSALYIPKKGITFFSNGVKTHQVNSVEFARAFADVWLGDKSSEPSLRAELVGK